MTHLARVFKGKCDRSEWFDAWVLCVKAFSFMLPKPDHNDATLQVNFHTFAVWCMPDPSREAQEMSSLYGRWSMSSPSPFPLQCMESASIAGQGTFPPLRCMETTSPPSLYGLQRWCTEGSPQPMGNVWRVPQCSAETALPFWYGAWIVLPLCTE